MGIFLNPGNDGFQSIRSDEYIDKTGLIDEINRTIGTPRRLSCISRPRRFGKSFAAQMLCAYYDKNCDSSDLFDDMLIAKKESYTEHRNRYNVVYIDMTYVKPFCDDYRNLTDYLQERLIAEIGVIYPDIDLTQELPAVMMDAVLTEGEKFIMIIDEWDAPIRENPQIEEDYLHFLRALFKSSGTTSRIFAAVYMTGILPIKKDGSQSAISDFTEYSMVEPQGFAGFIGFTEPEVQELCAQKMTSFEEMKTWYDGYDFEEVGAVYNPNSVMKAARSGRFTSYWTQTSAADNLMAYIDMDYDGLNRSVAALIAGMEVPVDPLGFSNDLFTFRGSDDVLTLLIHLGYLTFDPIKSTVRIPNEEVRREFARSVRMTNHAETVRRLQESDRLFVDTISCNEDAVAAQIEKIHGEETAPIHYNREDSLRSVIKLAYYTYRDHYLQWEELPAGEGYADIVYLPKKSSDYPALVVELKWSESAQGAIAQILDRKYPNALRNYGSEILLVGISYDKSAPAGHRKHHCRIQKFYPGFD